MAYDKKVLEKQALEAIKEHNLTTNEQVICFLPCSEATFYNHKLGELEAIKKEIENNRVKRKIKLIKKLEDYDSPTATIAAIKLYATEDELRRLNPPKEKKEEENTGKPKPLVEWTEENTENE